MSSTPASRPLPSESADPPVQIIPTRIDTSRPERMTARVVEFGDVTAGIAVPEHGGVRFYSSQRRFDALDGRLFGSFEQANRAVRERVRPVPATSADRAPRQLRAS